MTDHFGQQMSHFQMITPNDPYKALVVQRVVSVPEPDYKAHAKTRCVTCTEWCWLGEESFRFITAGNGVPLCVECATKNNHIRPDTLFGVLSDP